MQEFYEGRRRPRKIPNTVSVSSLLVHLWERCSATVSSLSSTMPGRLITTAASRVVVPYTRLRFNNLPRRHPDVFASQPRMRSLRNVLASDHDTTLHAPRLGGPRQFPLYVEWGVHPFRGLSLYPADGPRPPTPQWLHHVGLYQS